MSTIAELQRRVGEVNIANGWRKDDAHKTSTDKQVMMLALIMTEASEGIEELRDGRGVTETYYSGGVQTNRGLSEDRRLDANGDLRKPEGVPSELADAVIRALDCADAWGIDLTAAIEEKLAYNATRGHRHGGKVA